MKSDIQIAQEAVLAPIGEVAERKVGPREVRRTFPRRPSSSP